MLKMKGVSDVEELASKVPDNEARYHLFRHKHTHEGDYLESTGEVTHLSLFRLDSCPTCTGLILSGLHSFRVHFSTENKMAHH